MIHIALKLELVPNLEGIVDPGLDLDSDESDPNFVNVRIHKAKIFGRLGAWSISFMSREMVP